MPGKHPRRSRRGHNVFWAILLARFQHPRYHRAEIRDQPDKPDKDTELVKTHYHPFIFSYQHNCGPDGVDEHQDNRQQAGDSVNVEGHAAHEIEHHAGAPGIANQPEPEEGRMPDFESTLKAFTPNPNRVKQ